MGCRSEGQCTAHLLEPILSIQGTLALFSAIPIGIQDRSLDRKAITLVFEPPVLSRLAFATARDSRILLTMAVAGLDGIPQT
jgi:hypothetical protein